LADKKGNKEVKKSKLIMQDEAKKRTSTLLVYTCIAIITIVTYFVFSPSLDDGFTNWDDNTYVTDNPLVITNSVPVVKIFESPVASNYHPLTVLSLALNYQDGKLDPFGYHLVNIIFHLLNTILVFLFVFLLTRRNLMMATIVSLFFGIHPMHVESVTWVSERKDVLYVFFFLAGLITYLHYSETKKIVWYFFTFLLFILSCLSKGMAVVFPIILLLVDYIESAKWSKRIFVEKIPFVIFSIAFGVIAVNVQQSGQAISGIEIFTIFQRLMFVSYGAMMYMVKLFVPFKLSAFYPYPITNINSSVPLIFHLSPFIILGIIATIIYFFIKKEKEIVFGLLFYFTSVILVLQFISVGRVIMADRYTYLSYIGVLFVVAHLVNKAWQSKNGILALIKYPVMIIAIIGAIIFSYQAYSRTQVWKNSEVLWTDVIDNYPNSSVAFYNRACYYYNVHNANNALSDLNNDLQINPYDKEAYYDRGALYTKYYNRNDLAIADYTKTIIIDPAYKNAWFSRALLYYNEGEGDSAMADYNMTIKLDPDYTTAYTNRGILYYKYGKNNLAISDFTKAIELDSTAADAYNDRGTVYMNTGKNDSALADYNKAVAHDPSSAPCYYNRGLYYKSIDQYEKAVNDFTSGIQLNPQNVESYYNMRGECNSSIQKYNEAMADFSKAIELNPSVARYWLNRSLVEGKTGQNENAKADALKSQQLQKK
jgi:protein O-mannosyl-transferase